MKRDRSDRLGLSYLYDVTFSIIKKRYDGNLENFAKAFFMKKGFEVCISKDLILRNTALDKAKRKYDIKTLKDLRKTKEKFVVFLKKYLSQHRIENLLNLIKEKGCPDLMLIDEKEKKIFFIELKNTNDGIKINQIRWIGRAKKLRFPTFVVHFEKSKQTFHT